jgi:hypothetical protein
VVHGVERSGAGHARHEPHDIGCMETGGGGAAGKL